MRATRASHLILIDLRNSSNENNKDIGVELESKQSVPKLGIVILPTV
jgi:hypothetical protein